MYFRLQNRVLGLFLCVLEPTEDVKAARVHLSEPQEGCCNLWFYEDGRIKNQVSVKHAMRKDICHRSAAEL